MGLFSCVGLLRIASPDFFHENGIKPKSRFRIEEMIHTRGIADAFKWRVMGVLLVFIL